jgi:hypothetical protein
MTAPASRRTGGSFLTLSAVSLAPGIALSAVVILVLVICGVLVIGLA